MFDLHCHILPKVDDGSRSLKESIAMLHAARARNIDRIVCTPHCKTSHFDPKKIRGSFNTLKPYADALNIELIQGFELHWRKLSEVGTEGAQKYCFEGTNLLLLEFSVDAMPAKWQVILNNLAREGIQVIVAHPERYVEVQENINIAYEMKNLGCLLQLSANFAEGGFLDKRKKCAVSLLKAGLVDYIASDAHRPHHFDMLDDALAIARKY